MAKNTTVALSLAACSGVIGFHVSEPALYRGLAMAPALESAQPAQKSKVDLTAADISNKQVGELQAELLRLRLLFRRVAEVSELDGGEFELAVQLADERYLTSLTMVEEDEEFLQNRFASAKVAIAKLSQSAELMLSLAQRRYRDQKFTLSGSPVARTRITSRYGYRLDPLSGGRRLHRGLDFGGSAGTKVMALADGIVTYSGMNGGYGNLVELEHADGYRTRYAHNKENLVEVGAKVIKGQSIATMGSTGNSTGTHLHLEVRNDGDTVDPMEFIVPEP